ncbi:MAG TPA: HD domain-containing phosphohydrolase [Thermoanaerobaculia bacterium]|nr:HD domain-containing phosphohydrolase [Thermoanaerobaculia bacterium]
MRIEATSLSTRVGRRILLLFALSSLAPLSVVIWLSVRGLALDLRGIEEAQLEMIGRDLADGIHGRFELIEDRLALSAQQLASGGSPAGATEATGADEASILPRGLRSIGTLEDSTRLPEEVVEFLSQVLDTIGRGTHLAFFPRGLVVVARRVERGDEDETVVWAEADPSWLWWGAAAEAVLPPNLDLTVFDSTGHELLTTNRELADALPADLRRPEALFGRDEVASEGDDHFVRFWRLPLHMFAESPSLALVLSDSGSSFDPIFGRQIRTLVLAGVFALLLVALLSVFQIRRTLEPLFALSRGIASVGGGEFGRRVSVRSGDEFELLADAFNRMARRLEQQFQSLQAANAIDRAILSATEPQRILEIALEGIGQLLPVDQAAIRIYGASGGCDALYSYAADQPGGVERRLEPPVDEMAGREPPHLILDRVSEPCAWWPALRIGASTSVLRVPVGDRGFVAVSCAQGESYDDRHLKRLEALGDQLAVALANAGLIENLSRMHQGALVAFARAVDLKSPWTGGHSERVARSARDLAAHLGFPPEDQDRLYRAGLLHDIGKIGVPDYILDKPGRLTPEEFLQVQEHVSLGATLLEAIPGFDEILPPVWQHHEHWDGTGYPRGIAATEISLDGRILGIVDVYDALTSARPYRAAMTPERAHDIIRSESGTHFDPDLVLAFLELLARHPTSSALEPARGAANQSSA